MTASSEERARRWRLVLGKDAEVSRSETGADVAGIEAILGGDDLGIDAVLEALYDSDRGAGLGSSAPDVNRWLGDIRRYFPSPVVQVMQRDALERLKLDALLLEPELLETFAPDVHLVATLLALKNVIPRRTKATARAVVRKVVADIERRLRHGTASAVRGALSRATRSHRPRPADIDFDRTIKKNLRNWLPSEKTIVAERLVGRGRRAAALRDIVLCVDQSGSMAASVVYASIFAAVLASLRSVRSRMIVFDTAVVDLSDKLHDPVDLLFGATLGGGTDIARALGYCDATIQRPAKTILVLISDLYEGGPKDEMLRRAARLVARGVNVVALLALSDRGAPSFDAANAAAFAGLGIPAFACTPELFPPLIAAAIERQDVALWAARAGIVAPR
jgi:Mg-chelatase subunit ChlD